MIEYVVHDFYRHMFLLDEYIRIHGNHENPDDAKKDIDPLQKGAIADFVVEGIIKETQRLDIAGPLFFKATTLQSQLIAKLPISSEVLVSELVGLKQDIFYAISSRKFSYIPEANAEYFEKEQLFGEKVYNCFKSARQDIKDAGNSYAASLHTACVFHLMRVAEHGLRRLARRVGVKTATHNGKLIPLEYADWNDVVTAIHKKITLALTLPRNAKRERKLQSYSDANQHCLFMKDIWRNTASHARKAYSHPEALNALERVRDFMQFLARELGAL